MTPAAVAPPAPPDYRCTVCGAGWSYEEIRYVARCKHCGSGLTRVVPDAAQPAVASRS